MRFFPRILVAAGLLAAGLSLAGSGVQAQSSYPSETVRVIVTFPPGGSSDAVGRFVAEGLSKLHDHQFIVDNRGGANGGTGTQAAIDAAPDGNTLLLGSSGVLLVNPQLYADLHYNAANDLQAIGPLVELSSVAIISNRLHDEQHINSMTDLIAYAKANPGKLNFGSGGIGNGGHLAGELLKKTAGIDMVHIPFQGGAAATQALVAGDIDLIFSTTPEALPVIRGGNAIPIAAMTFERIAALPDVPTISESGVKGAELSSWMGIFAPKGTPDDIVATLEGDIKKLLSTDDAKKFFDNLSLTITPGTSDDLENLVVSDGPRLTEFLKAAGATVQ